MGDRSAYRAPFNRIGICASRRRDAAPRPCRHSSRTTPRSLSTASGSNETLCAQSSMMSSDRSITAGRSVGICSWYTVSSKLVCAFTCAPNRMPSAWMNATTSCPGKCSVPLKAMCSTKCARPRWLSSSSTDPALTTSRSSARPRGCPFARTKYCSPLGSRPSRICGSTAMTWVSASVAAVVAARWATAGSGREDDDDEGEQQPARACGHDSSLHRRQGRPDAWRAGQSLAALGLAGAS